MTEEKAKKLFHNCFPADIVSTIRDIGYEEEIEVYRICRWGKIDKQAFLSTYEEYKQGLINLRDGIDENNVGSFSTSTFEKTNDTRRYYKYASNSCRYPKAIIVKLKTLKHLGLLQRTKEREKTSYKSHIDWWLYENAAPHEERNNLKEVSIDELS